MGNECVLKLEHLLFDEIHFERTGFKNDEDVDYEMQVVISHDKDSQSRISKVTLIIIADKEEEYKIKISVTGFFKIKVEDKKDKMRLLQQNAVAILMPYIRSQLSLLTAQPETESIVLPPFNIAAMIKNSSTE